MQLFQKAQGQLVSIISSLHTTCPQTQWGKQSFTCFIISSVLYILKYHTKLTTVLCSSTSFPQGCTALLHYLLDILVVQESRLVIMEARGWDLLQQRMLPPPLTTRWCSKWISTDSMRWVSVECLPFSSADETEAQHIYMAASQTLELENCIWETEDFLRHLVVFIL